MVWILNQVNPEKNTDLSQFIRASLKIIKENPGLTIVNTKKVDDFKGKNEVKENEVLKVEEEKEVEEEVKEKEEKKEAKKSEVKDT